MDVVIVIDDSGSMKKIFANVLESVKKNILENFVIDGDSVHFIVFSTDTRFIYSEKNVKKAQLIEKITPQIDVLEAKGKHTDFGRVMRYLKDYLEKNTTLDKKFTFFLTDGKNDPADNSEFYSDRHKIAEQLIQFTKPIKLQGVNFLCFGIGLNTDIKLIADMVGGEYIEINKSFDENEFKAKLTSMVGFIDLNLDGNFGRYNGEKTVTLNLVSNYGIPVKTRITSVTMKDLTGKSGVLNGTSNLLKEPVTIELKPNEKIEVPVRLNALSDVPSGKYTGYLSFELENKIKFSPSVAKVSFTRGGCWWWVVLAVLLLLFFFKKKWGVLLAALRKTWFKAVLNPFDKLKEKLSAWIKKYSKLNQIFLKISDKTDSASEKILQYLKHTGKKILLGMMLFLKFLSRYLLFFPLGYVLYKLGGWLLKIDAKIKGK
jgi:hypothetical protein